GATNKALYKSFKKLMKDKFQMSSMGELTFFGSSGKSASTTIDTEKPLLKDSDGKDVDVHIYRSMIGSLMYLTSSRPDIMFAVCACAHFQVTPKASHLHAVKRIFRYLKGKPHLGLWYPKDSPFDLVAYSDSDYAYASMDRKSTTRGCQFLGCRLISWQCKKQTVVATSYTEAEYVVGASCCAQVLWIQNQMLDYGLQALVDKKKVVVNEAAIRDALHLDDAEGVDCLPNEEIFIELAHLEIIKLQTRVKKLERENKVKALKLKRLRKVETSQRVDTSDDTIMEDVSNQERIIDELDKDEGAMLMNEKEETEEVRDNTDDTQVEERQTDIYQINMDHAAKVLSMQEDESEVHEAVEVVTTAKLITKVIVAVSKTVSAAAVAPTVTAAPVKVVVPFTR
nr:hypothetical protein [Tanacetum cinerariifolium]